jgi:hypothetical protein
MAGLNAQTYPWIGEYYNEIPVRGDVYDSSIAANHYSSMTRTLTRYSKKGKPRKRTSTFTFTYDDKGYLTSLYETNSANKKSEKYEYAYKDSFPSRYSRYKNGKLAIQYDIMRNSGKRITDLIKKNSKGKVILRQHTDFDPNTNYITRIVIYDKNNQEKKAIEYTWYEGKTMKQAKEYRKGKLKKVWDYSCDPKGIDEKKVKEIKVCKNVNVDENGNRVESNRIVNHKGEVELRINTFDKNERFISQKVYDDLKHKLQSEFETITVNGTEEIIHKNYNRKERLVMISKSVYNNSHKLISSEYSIGKKLKRVYKNTFEYDNKNLLTHSVGIDEKNRKVWENIHTYN